MMKRRHYRHHLSSLALAIVCAAGTAGAQNYVPASANLLPVLDSKEAAKMVRVQATPEYPPLAKVNYVEGHVHLEITVDRNGKVVTARVLDGSAVLAESVLRAARGWIYRPLATPLGPSGFMTTVGVKFVLPDWRAALTPQQAEQAFERQVKQPQVVRPAEDGKGGYAVSMRLLVNDKGKVVDWGGSPKDKSQFEAAQATVRGWTFQPAHWGNLPVASYVNIKVPISEPSIARTAANYVGR
jgi:TonB family protein